MQKRVRAIIIENDELLTLKRIKESGVYWTFPGGGVESDENDVEALSRECKEELGVDVEVGQLLADNAFMHPIYGGQHEFFYFCKIVGGELGTGDGPEYQENSGYEGTHEIEWLKMKELESFDLRPVEIKSRIETV